MDYVFVFLAGAVAAASALGIWYFGTYVLLWKEKWSLAGREDELAWRAKALDDRERAVNESLRIKAEESEKTVASQRHFLEEQRTHHEREIAGRYHAVEERANSLKREIEEFNARKVKYDSLSRENDGLKQDLFNLSVHLKKLDRDHAALAQNQEEIDRRANQLAERYLEENVSWIGAKLTANNFSSSKQRLLKVLEACRGIGFLVSADKEEELVENLQKDFEQAVRDEFARQEQARIKAQVREEEKLAREIDKQIKDAEREKAAIQAALEKALKETQDEHSAEVELLRARLKEAEEKAQRAISQAQLTKSGHVYVLSNIGSFGDGVFKVGMTRRLEPMERVHELSGASVPFPFDVHMMISCDDAPSLENALHRELHKQRLNRVNFRKEFFRADVESIRKVVELQHGVVDYVAEPAALQYHESMTMGDEDYEFVEQTVKSVVGEDDGALADD